MPPPSRLLELPLPEADALGRPVWDVDPKDISRSYRRLSVLVHPDKNLGPDARQAFEALKEAYGTLRDPDRLVRRPRSRRAEHAARRRKTHTHVPRVAEGGVWPPCAPAPVPSPRSRAPAQGTLLQHHLGSAIRRRRDKEAGASLDERVAQNAAQTAQAAALRKQEVSRPAGRSSWRRVRGPGNACRGPVCVGLAMPALGVTAPVLLKRWLPPAPLVCGADVLCHTPPTASQGSDFQAHLVNQMKARQAKSALKRQRAELAHR